MEAFEVVIALPGPARRSPTCAPIWRPIASLALGAVALTPNLVAIVARLLVHGLPWGFDDSGYPPGMVSC